MMLQIIFKHSLKNNWLNNNVNAVTFILLLIWATVGFAQNDPISESTRNHLIDKILVHTSLAQLNQSQNQWVSLTSGKIQTNTFDLGKNFYDSETPISIYTISNAEWVIKYRITDNLPSIEDLKNKIIFKIRWIKGTVSRDVMSTLCPKNARPEERCLPSSFKISYNLANSTMDISPGSGPGLLRYDFESKQHVQYTNENIASLNCILKTELPLADSFLWSFKGMKKMDQTPTIEEKTQEKVDAITGATEIANEHPKPGCQIPDGALWTTLSVFAHSYETQYKIQSLTRERQIEIFSGQKLLPTRATKLNQ